MLPSGPFDIRHLYYCVSLLVKLLLFALHRVEIIAHADAWAPHGLIFSFPDLSNYALLKYLRACSNGEELLSRHMLHLAWVLGGFLVVGVGEINFKGDELA